MIHLYAVWLETVQGNRLTDQFRRSKMCNTHLTQFKLRCTRGDVDIFDGPDGVYWQSIIYREEDGYFCEPCNGPFKTAAEALMHAYPILEHTRWLLANDVFEFKAYNEVGTTKMGE